MRSISLQTISNLKPYQSNGNVGPFGVRSPLESPGSPLESPGSPLESPGRVPLVQKYEHFRGWSRSVEITSLNSAAEIFSQNGV